MSTDGPKLVRWSADRGLPRLEELRSELEAEGASPQRMVDPPCTQYPTRESLRAETRWVIEGRLLVGLEVAPYERFELRSGDRLDLPAGLRYWIRVLSDNGATYLLAQSRD